MAGLEGPEAKRRPPLLARIPRTVAYATLPRPQELALKPFVLLIAYAAGRWASPDAGPSLLAVLGIVVAVEALAYQARYAVNDLLDASIDAEHPASHHRRRLPPERAARRWAVGSIVIRLAAAVMVVLALPAPVRGVGVSAVIAVVVAAVPYEAVRQGLRRTPSPVGVVGRLTPAVAAVYALVGAGFAIRVGTGLAVAGAPRSTVVIAASFAWPLGVLFTTLSWALQATCYVLPAWTGLDSRLVRKRQLGPLLGWAGACRPQQPAWPNPPTETRILAPPLSLRTAWGVAAVGAALGAAVVGANLATRFQGVGPLWSLAALGAVCSAATVLTLRTSLVDGAVTAPGATVAALAVAASVLVAVAAGHGLPHLAGLPIASLLVTIGVLRNLTYHDVIALTVAPSAIGGARGTT